MRALTFRWHRWESEGVARRSLWCGRCGFAASPFVADTAAESEHEAASKEHRCAEPRYSWDEWRHAAHDRGMAPETADVGRQLLREHHQHGWTGDVDHEAMMRRGLGAPAYARRRWQRLLDEGANTERRGELPHVDLK